MNEWFDREIAEKLSIRDINYLKNSNQIKSSQQRLGNLQRGKR